MHSCLAAPQPSHRGSPTRACGNGPTRGVVSSLSSELPSLFPFPSRGDYYQLLFFTTRHWHYLVTIIRSLFIKLTEVLPASFLYKSACQRSIHLMDELIIMSLPEEKACFPRGNEYAFSTRHDSHPVGFIREVKCLQLTRKLSHRRRATAGPSERRSVMTVARDNA